MDDTLVMVLLMAGVAVLLLLGAIIADRRLEQRMQRRLRGEEVQDAARRPDAADAVIELLNRARSAVHSTVEGAAGEAGKEKG